MHLIWYDSNTHKYIYGDVKEYRIVKSKHIKPDSMTILMEFPNADHSLATKIIRELNNANDQVKLGVI